MHGVGELRKESIHVEEREPGELEHTVCEWNIKGGADELQARLDWSCGE